MANAIPIQYRANLIMMKFATRMKMLWKNATITEWYDSVNVKRAIKIWHNLVKNRERWLEENQKELSCVS